MIEHFSLERVNKAAASFDPQKLLAFQERYMTALPVDAKVERTLPYLEKAGRPAPMRQPDPNPRVERRSSRPRATGSRSPATSWTTASSSSADDAS